VGARGLGVIEARRIEVIGVVDDDLTPERLQTSSCKIIVAEREVIYLVAPNKLAQRGGSLILANVDSCEVHGDCISLLIVSDSLVAVTSSENFTQLLLCLIYVTRDGQNLTAWIDVA
jgi:hypothetical protein